MKKLIIALSVVVIIVIPLLSCSNKQDKQVNDPDTFPIVNKQIELNMYITPPENVKDIHTNEAILWLEDYTNIDFDLIVGPAKNSSGKVELLLASGSSLPEVFFTKDGLTTEQLSIYGEKGLLVALNPYIDEYAPNLKKAIEYNPLILDQITMADGNIYSFARYNEEQHVLYSQKMWINKTWLDYLGMELPNTIEEVEKVLLEFSQNDCNQNGIADEIAFSGMSDKWRTDLYGFMMQPFTLVSEEEDLWMIVDENLTIIPTVFEDGFKEGISFLHHLYSEGLLDPNVFVNNSDIIKSLTGNKSGNRIGLIQAGGLATVVDLGAEGARDEYVALPPLKSMKEGERRTPHFRPDARNVFSITSSCQNVEAAVRLGDLLMIDPFIEDGVS